MSVEDDIKAKEAELEKLRKDKAELDRLAKAKEAELEAELQKKRLENWEPTTANVRAAMKEERQYVSWGDRKYTSPIAEIIQEEKNADYNGIYSFNHVETYGGGEGDGEEHWIVFTVNKGEEIVSYWKVPGWYQSYHGGELEWGNIFEVEPVEVTVTQYNKK